MQSLIDNIIALENEADEQIEKARAEAQKIRAAAEEELRLYREELARELEQRLKEMRQSAEKQFQQAVTDEEQRSKEALNTIANIPQNIIQSQIDRVLSRFREK